MPNELVNLHCLLFSFFCFWLRSACCWSLSYFTSSLCPLDSGLYLLLRSSYLLYLFLSFFVVLLLCLLPYVSLLLFNLYLPFSCSLLFHSFVFMEFLSSFLFGFMQFRSSFWFGLFLRFCGFLLYLLSFACFFVQLCLVLLFFFSFLFLIRFRSAFS